MFFLNRLFSVMIASCLCALIFTQQVHTKDKSNLPPLTDETCTEVPVDTEVNRGELSKRDILSCSDIMKKKEELHKRMSSELKRRRKIDKEFIDSIKDVVDRAMRELQIMAKMKKISRSRIRPLE